MFSHILALIASFLIFVSCKSRNQTQQSDVKFDTYSLERGEKGLMPKVFQDELRFCFDSKIRDAEGMKMDRFITDRKLWEEWIRNSIYKWLAALTPIIKKTLNPKIIFLGAEDGCVFEEYVAGTEMRDGAKIRRWESFAVKNRKISDLSIVLHPGKGGTYFFDGRIEAGAVKPELVSKAALLHEFGHAFNLVDTYSGGEVDCREGQPRGVMCSCFEATEPQGDDIDGIRFSFCQHYRDKYPNECKDVKPFEPRDSVNVPRLGIKIKNGINFKKLNVYSRKNEVIDYEHVIQTYFTKSHCGGQDRYPLKNYLCEDQFEAGGVIITSIDDTSPIKSLNIGTNETIRSIDGIRIDHVNHFVWRLEDKTKVTFEICKDFDPDFLWKTYDHQKDFSYYFKANPPFRNCRNVSVTLP